MALIDNPVSNDIITGRIPINMRSLLEVYLTVILGLQQLRTLVFIKEDHNCSDFF